MKINTNAILSLDNVKDDSDLDIAGLDDSFQLQTVKLSETTLAALTEAVVNLDPSTIIATNGLNPDETQPVVVSLNELHQECRKTNNFRPYFDAIMDLVRQNNCQDKKIYPDCNLSGAAKKPASSKK